MWVYEQLALLCFYVSSHNAILAVTAFLDLKLQIQCEYLSHVILSLYLYLSLCWMSPVW